MTVGLTSIIIPTYQHARWLPEAIACALAQTAPVEVLVVDDGSTDETASVLARYGDQIRVITQAHAGPCAARNAGIDAASGEFFMLLDADDLIAPTKVASQLAEFAEHPEAGWVLCDVEIHNEATSTTTRASMQYHYAEKELGGWIHKLLLAGNFIPIMSPLVRRSAVPDWIRFHDAKVPEDWHFWTELSTVARVRYVPQVLATYRKKTTGRSRLPTMARVVSPTIESPLRLNLGCGTPDTRSWHPMPGLVNLDKSLGWRFEDGLKDFQDHTVHGITISHALMYLPETQWWPFFADVARVLVEGGVIRITEDETESEASSRRGGWKGSQPAVTLTTPAFVQHYLERAGLAVQHVTRDTTYYKDHSLRQAQHGDAPDVFFIEGIKLAGVVFAPHSDDEALFAAFTILRNRPRVIVCFESSGDYGDTARREAETRDAMQVLGAGPVEQWHGGDLVAQMQAFEERVHPVRVWAPSRDTSHPDHLAVAEAARQVFGSRVTAYHTYRDGEKVRRGRVVPFEPVWLAQKHRALARYESQITHPRAHQFFAWDLLEFEDTEGAA